MHQNDNSAVIHAIKTAEASLKLARQLLSGAKDMPTNSRDLSRLPYIEGTFDGVNMTDASGKKYRVNANYATKSMLVYGDKLRAYSENGHYWFKQVDKVKREKVDGMLTKKANAWFVVTADGSYQVSPEAVEFLNLAINDEVEVFLPANNKRVPFATLNFVKKVVKKGVKDEQAVLPVEDKKGSLPVKTESKAKEAVVSAKKENESESSQEKKIIPQESAKKLPAPASQKKEKAVKSDPASSKEKEKVVLEDDDLR